MSSTISIEIAGDVAAMNAMRHEWTGLFAKAGPCPFLSWDWLTTWYRSFGGGSTPFILKAYRDKSLIGILPLRRIAKRVPGIGVTQLALLGDDHGGADYLDVIANALDRTAVTDAFVSYLLNEKAGADAIILNNLAASSPLRESLRAAAGTSDQYFERDGFVCPQIDLSSGWSGILASCRRSSNFKRRLKQLERMEGFEFRSVSEAASLTAAFERFIELHNKRWAGRGGSDLSGGPHLLGFHQALINQMAGSGLLRFDELWVQGKCVASIYGFDNGYSFYYFNAGYDPAWAPQSVGLVLTGLSIKATCERGCHTYDFLRGDEAYKFDWANRSETLVKACLVRRTVAGRTFATADKLNHTARRISRAVLPASVAAQLRNLRRMNRQDLKTSEAPAPVL